MKRICSPEDLRVGDQIRSPEFVKGSYCPHYEWGKGRVSFEWTGEDGGPMKKIEVGERVRVHDIKLGNLGCFHPGLSKYSGGFEYGYRLSGTPRKSPLDEEALDTEAFDSSRAEAVFEITYINGPEYPYESKIVAKRLEESGTPQKIEERIFFHLNPIPLERWEDSVRFVERID